MNTLTMQYMWLWLELGLNLILLYNDDFTALQAHYNAL